MENNFINNEIIDILDGRLMFNSSGLVYKEALKMDSKSDGKIEINTRFAYTGGAGIAFFIHDDLNYIAFEINETTSTVLRVFDGRKSIINSVQLSEDVVFEINNLYEVRVVINGYNIKTYIKNTTNDDYILLNNCDQSSFITGCIGLLGIESKHDFSEEQDVIFSEYDSFSIKKETKTSWNKNIYTMGSLIDFNKTNDNSVNEFIFMLEEDNHDFINSQNDILLSDNYNQELRIEENGDYTLSIDYEGSVFLAIKSDNELIFKELQFTDLKRRGSLTYNSNGEEDITIYIGSIRSGMNKGSRVQFEKGYGSLYTASSRGESKLSFPISKISSNELLIESGVISTKIRSINDNHENDYVFYYNDSFNLRINNDTIILLYGDVETSLNVATQNSQDIRLSAIWNEDEITLDIYNYSTGEFSVKSSANTIGQIPSSKNIHVGCDENSQSNFLIDDFKILPHISDMNLIRSQFIYNDKSHSDFAIKVDFDKETMIYNENKINIPFFDMNSPLIIEDKEQDIVYSRVAFFDEKTLEYKLYNKERHSLFYTDEIVVNFDNILKIWAIDDSGNEYEDIEIIKKDLGSSVVTINDITDKSIESVDLYYILKDTYCITEDIVSGNYLIELSNVYGSGITATVEQEVEYEDSLIKSIELNPFKSTNNTGFIFLEEEKRPVRFLYANASPDSIVANGYDRSIITLDCLDKDSVKTNDVYFYDHNDPSRLTVYSKHGYGKVELYMSDEEKAWWNYLREHGREVCERDLGELINDENRAGRYIFIYTPYPFLNEKEVEKEDYVVIVDGNTQLSTEIPIRIVGGW